MELLQGAPNGWGLYMEVLQQQELNRAIAFLLERFDALLLIKIAQ